MSNTRRPKWSAAVISAANAEAELAGLAESVAGEDPATTRSLLLLWDQLDAAGLAGEFPALAEEIRADSARKVVGGGLLARLLAQDADPGLIADLEQKLAGGGTDYWAGVYRQAQHMTS